MKICRFQNNTDISWGIIEDGKIYKTDTDIDKGFLISPDKKITGMGFDIDTVKLLAPVIPEKIIAVGLNYADHVKEINDRPLPKNPVLFVKLPCTVIGPEEYIQIPEDAKRVDYEAELAVVINKKCFRADKSEALSCILGASCLNDVTEREVQSQDGQWIRAKNFPTFCPIGPYIVTGIDYDNLDIKLLHNGNIKQSSSTKHFIFDTASLISFISQSIPLMPGDVVTTGTPSGIGSVVPGDTVIVEIEKIGRLVNYVK